jgi:hypothetical protein
VAQSARHAHPRHGCHNAGARAPPRLTDESWKWRDDYELKVREHAATVFLTGQPRALFDVGDELTTCADEVTHDRSFRKFGETQVTQLNGWGKARRRDDGWEIWVVARSWKYQGAKA